ncbi:hypothetical protein OSTOST_09510 [Ostertagia ostertagi]
MGPTSYGEAIYSRPVQPTISESHKSCQRTDVPDEKTLETFLVDTDDCINTSTKKKSVETPAPLPIDFIRDMIITYLCETWEWKTAVLYERDNTNQDGDQTAIKPWKK